MAFPLQGYQPPHSPRRLDDFLRFKGISHYEDPIGADKLTALPCPGELLVEEHHRNYGEPSVGEHDVFEFLASSIHLSPDARVLEIECDTPCWVAFHMLYLNPEHFHCLEIDELSLMAAFLYELPSQGLDPYHYQNPYQPPEPPACSPSLVQQPMLFSHPLVAFRLPLCMSKASLFSTSEWSAKARNKP